MTGLKTLRSERKTAADINRAEDTNKHYKGREQWLQG